MSNRASGHIGWTAARCLSRTNVTRSCKTIAPKSVSSSLSDEEFLRCRIKAQCGQNRHRFLILTARMEPAGVHERCEEAAQSHLTTSIKVSERRDVGRGKARRRRAAYIVEGAK